MLFQEGRSSNLWLRRGDAQFARTRNNPRVKCTGVFTCELCELQEGEVSGARTRNLLADQCLSSGRRRER